MPVTQQAISWTNIELVELARIHEIISALWHIYASLNSVIIGLDNGLAPVQIQAVAEKMMNRNDSYKKIMLAIY